MKLFCGSGKYIINKVGVVAEVFNRRLAEHIVLKEVTKVIRMADFLENFIANLTNCVDSNVTITEYVLGCGNRRDLRENNLLGTFNEYAPLLYIIAIVEFYVCALKPDYMSYQRDKRNNEPEE